MQYIPYSCMLKCRRDGWVVMHWFKIENTIVITYYD
jgi:hypothetical protein